MEARWGFTAFYDPPRKLAKARFRPSRGRVKSLGAFTSSVLC